MLRPASTRKIRPFIRKYGVNESQFEKPVEAFSSFNEFFMRTLKAEARPVDSAPETVVFPADGRHSGWGRLGEEQGVLVKGQRWDLPALLDGDTEWIRLFTGGALVLSRLCPTDYHHFHFPAAGLVGRSFTVGERLFSVSPIALRRNLGFLWENRRCFTLLETEAFGKVGLIEIGATNVGSIQQAPRPDRTLVAKGDRKGWFEFGGSSVITLFEPGRIHLSRDLIDCTASGTELYAHMGDAMGALP